MFAFFVSLYMSLFSGEWGEVTTANAGSWLKTLMDDLANLLVNALGGEFTTLQTFNFSLTGQQMVSLALALVTFCGFCFAVWKIVKYTLSIFFYGWRR